MKRFFLFAFFCLATACWGQEAESRLPVKGNWEIGLIGGTGRALDNAFRGVHSSADLFFAGLRFGRITASGKGWNLEYAVEAIPAFLAIQETDVYAVEFVPVLFRWSFETKAGVVPDFEWGAGILLSSDTIPPGASSFNFTPQASVGISIRTRQRQALRFGVKYIHISNAGLGEHNPGFNSFNAVVSYHWFH